MEAWRMRGVALILLSLALVNAAPFTLKSAVKIKPDPPVIIVRDPGTTKPRVAAESESYMKERFPDALNNANQDNTSYPLLPQGELSIKDSSQQVAPPLKLDGELRDSEGIPRPNVVFGYDITGSINSMEKKTPLYDETPCIERPLVVEIPALHNVEALSLPHPFLPQRFGCSKEKELSREKASPEVRVSNYTADIVDFSFQMISMGNQECSMDPEDGFNRIHWHVVGVKADPSGITKLVEGASHDKRLLHGGVEQPNQYLEEYYSGPCPEPGKTECFRLKVLGHKPDGKTCMCGFSDFFFERPFNFQIQGQMVSDSVPDLDQAILPPVNEMSKSKKITLIDASNDPVQNDEQTSSPQEVEPAQSSPNTDASVASETPESSEAQDAASTDVGTVQEKGETDVQTPKTDEQESAVSEVESKKTDDLDTVSEESSSTKDHDGRNSATVKKGKHAEEDPAVVEIDEATEQAINDLREASQRMKAELKAKSRAEKEKTKAKKEGVELKNKKAKAQEA